MFRSDRNSNQQFAPVQTSNNQPSAAHYPNNTAPAAVPQPPPLYSTNPSLAISETEALARDIREGTLTSFVGEATVLSGEASFKGMLRIDGHVSGMVTSESGTLIVGTGGRVDADIDVAVAIVYGTVNGDIVANKRIEIGRTARVLGNIQAPTLVMEQGAVFEGSCRMLQSKEEADTKRQKEIEESEASIRGTVEELSTVGQPQLATV